MGKRDFHGRETKKPKKATKKTSIDSVLPTEAPAEVEVVRKKHKKETEEPGV
jgi:hypothetical protein